MRLVDKLIRVEKHLSKKKGPFDLFAMVMREDLSDKWDILVAADWIENNFDSSLKFISKELTKKLSSDELSAISKVVLLSIFDPRVKSVQKLMEIEHLDAELINVHVFGFFVNHAFIITSKRRLDERLKEITWNVILDEWKKGERSITGNKIFKKVSTARKSASRNAVAKVLDHFMQAGYIQAKAKSGTPLLPDTMVITSVKPTALASV
jgi:hypothetical protein